jgi:PAS domain S-box-containing protein
MPSPLQAAIVSVIAAGAVLLLLAGLQAGAMSSLRPNMPATRAWLVLRWFIVVFAIGYCGIIGVVWMDRVDLLAALASLIMLGGGAFVYIVVRVSRSSLARLLETTLSRDYVRSVIDAMPDALLIIDARGIITSCNRRAHELTGYDTVELCGRRLGELLAVNTDTASVMRGSRPREQDLWTKGGAKIPVSAVFAATRSEDAASSTVCVITDRREEHRLSRQLEQAVLFAESAMGARNQLAATLSDEGLPRLQELRAAAEGLASADLSAPQLDALQVLHGELAALERVVHGLVERIHGVDALGRATHTVELARVLEAVCSKLRALAGTVRLSWHLADDVPARYLGNDSLVFEVLVLLGRYLLGNGRPNALEWTVARAPGERERLLFTVSTDEDAPSAANSGSSSMVGRLTGTHMALASARLLVNTMGGKFWQADDASSRVFFTVTMEDAGAAEVAAGQPTPMMLLAATAGRYRALLDLPAPARRGDVLVVDDSPQAREILMHHLRRWGYEPVVAETGDECLRLLAGRRFDVLLLDVLLPDINGIEVLARIRERKLAGDLAVVMVSALEEKGSITASLELGAQDYISKPIDPAVLRARLSNIYEKKILHDQAKQQIDRLASEMRRSDDLLRVILPDKIAEELLATDSVVARRHEGVAVMFADIVGFTAYCESHPAEEVVVQLQALFIAIEDCASGTGSRRSRASATP